MILKMEAVFLSETLRHIAEDDATHLYSCSLIAEELHWIAMGGDMPGS
jgi:hypothetical protein